MFGRVIDRNIFDLLKLAAGRTEWQKMQITRPQLIEGNFAISNFSEVFNRDEMKKGEVPSANLHAAARGMAHLAAIMANRGKLIKVDGKTEHNNGRLLSEETWHKMHMGNKILTDTLFSKLF